MFTEDGIEEQQEILSRLGSSELRAEIQGQSVKLGIFLMIMLFNLKICKLLRLLIQALFLKIL